MRTQLAAAALALALVSIAALLLATGSAHAEEKLDDSW
jgi:hypothetical protein